MSYGCYEVGLWAVPTLHLDFPAPSPLQGEGWGGVKIYATPQTYLLNQKLGILVTNENTPKPITGAAEGRDR